jgi:uncharacterized protein YheU (UPF0270 family)
MIIPHDQLHPDTLHALIEEFVTRDGAVQGHTDTPLQRQIAAVMQQLKAGKAVIVVDTEAETCTIALKADLPMQASAEAAEDRTP